MTTQARLHLQSQGFRSGDNVMYGSDMYLLKSIYFSSIEAKASIVHLTKKGVSRTVDVGLLTAVPPVVKEEVDTPKKKPKKTPKGR